MKIGRNDPCPCGSGKKYKKCCLDKDKLEDRERARADLTPVVRWVSQNEELRNHLNPLIEKYFPNKIVTDDINFHMLLDAFIFDYKLPENGKSPFELYLKKAKLFPSEKEDYEKLSDNIYSAFEILEVETDKGMKMYDIVNEKEYYVKEKKGTHGVVIGDMITCRIWETGDSFRIMGPAAYNWPSEMVYLLKRFINTQSLKKTDKEISAFDILGIALKGDIPKTMDEIQNALKNKLKSLGIKFNFNELDKRINENTNPEKAFPEIFKFNFPSMDDYKETLELISRLWDSYPRKEFGGKSPKEEGEYGLKEQTLMQSLVKEAMASIDPDKYPSTKDVEKAFERFKEKWLHKPQKELDGKTPMEVILEEREMLGNPRKDISARLKISRIPDFDANRAEKLYFDAIAAEKEGNSEEAVEFLKEVVEISSDNYKAWGNMGASYAGLGEKGEALRCLRKSLSINPKYKIAKKNLKIIENLSEEEITRKAEKIRTSRRELESLKRNKKG